MTETDRIPYFPEYYEVVPSTNVLAAQFVKDDPPGWTVIWTGFQEEGKGQQGNRWESNSGENLLASWILYPRFLEPRQQFSLSVINSLAIIDLLNEFGVQGRIKWPNDIFTGNKKIAGMLIENSIEGSYLLYSVIGTGLNVNQTVFSKQLPNPVSLKSITGETYRIEEILYKLHVCLFERWERLRTFGVEQLMDEYISSLYLLNSIHQFKDDSGFFLARIMTVEPSGLLVLEDENSQIRKYAFKEVSFPELR